MRARRAPFAHSGFALSHAVVLQPFAHSVQVVSTACGLSHGRERKRYCLVVIAPTGQTSIRLPERIECTPCSLKVAISLPLPRLMVPICASPSTSRHEADAARAQDAAVAVEHQRRTEVDVGLHALAVERAARKVHAAFVVAERVREILQRALAALVAHRAVERVVDQEELEHALAAVDGFRILRVHHHAFGHRRRARRLQLRHLLDLDQADAARRVDAQTGVVAVIGDLDAGFDGGLQNGGAFRHGKLPAIDGQRDDFHKEGIVPSSRARSGLRPSARLYCFSMIATAAPSGLASTDRTVPVSGKRASLAASFDGHDELGGLAVGVGHRRP